MNTIGRGTWIDKIGKDIIKRELDLKRPIDNINVESGLGASGIPHIGSLGDAVRAYGIKLSLRDQGYQCNLITYSDDMDGLRKVPEGFPKSLNEEICKPVSSIVDPFGCHNSYGEHMSSLLLDGLEKLNIEYEFQSAVKAYKEGMLNEQIAKILSQSEEIGSKISEITGQTKFKNTLPYYPICKNCGKIYVNIPTSYNSKKNTLYYKCSGAEIGKKWINGCNYEGQLDIRDGEGKLSWKTEFAARWSAFNIKFEAYGKDIEDSVKINDWVSDNVLNFSHPYHIRYEMFLDKSGKKISKSIGNVLTPQKWLQYGTASSLLLLMFKRITGSRSLSVKDIPTYMDEVDAIEEVYFNKTILENKEKTIRTKGLYEYIHHLNPPEKISVHLPYRLLVELAEIAPENNSQEYVLKKLVEYQYIKETDENIIERINLGINWSRDFKSYNITDIKLNETEKNALLQLISLLENNSEPEIIQSEVFEIAKKYNIKPRLFFQLIYRILLGSDKGPRLGKYIIDADKTTIITKLKALITKS